MDVSQSNMSPAENKDTWNFKLNGDNSNKRTSSDIAIQRKNLLTHSSRRSKVKLLDISMRLPSEKIILLPYLNIVHDCVDSWDDRRGRVTVKCGSGNLVVDSEKIPFKNANAIINLITMFVVA